MCPGRADLLCPSFCGRVVRGRTESPCAYGSTILLSDDGRIMEFLAKCVSTSVSVGGDYYEASFAGEEDADDTDRPYLLIQRDFELPFDDRCYVETHDRRYCGHFRLRRIEFTPKKLVIELKRPSDSIVCVTLCMAISDFERALKVIKIISGEIEPEAE